MKRYICIIFNLILIMSLSVVLFGCSKEKEKHTSGFLVYYLNKDSTKVESEDYKLKETDTEPMIFEVIEKLSKGGKNKNHLAAIPENVAVNGFNLTDGIATIDFDERYNNMDTQREVLCRAAVVMTLSQIEAVEYVAFTINDVPYQIPGGNIVGVMQASDFVSDLSGGENKFAKTDFKLYFANEDGSKLKEYVLEEAKYGEKSKELFVVEQLIKGPKKDGYTATLSPKLELINITTANNICYVDFKENFLVEQSEVSNQLVIYSIVNSLSELNGIQKVQISINGDSAIKYHGDIPLSEPFIRDLDLIEIK